MAWHVLYQLRLAKQQITGILPKVKTKIRIVGIAEIYRFEVP